MNKRRTIMISLSVAGAAAAAGLPLTGLAQAKKDDSKAKDDSKGAGNRVDENDPQAVSLGYKHDTTKVDQKKFPKHETSQTCSACQFFQGDAKQAWAPCSIFSNKQVANKGWCSAWVKKNA